MKKKILSLRKKFLFIYLYTQIGVGEERGDIQNLISVLCNHKIEQNKKFETINFN